MGLGTFSSFGITKDEGANHVINFSGKFEFLL